MQVTAMQIYWNKGKCSLRKRVQLVQEMLTFGYWAMAAVLNECYETARALYV